MPGPFIYPQEIFDFGGSLPAFINPGPIPGAYAPLVAAIVAGMGSATLPTGAESSGPIAFTSGIGAGVKGNWAQMIASTAKAVLGLVLFVALPGGVITMALDIGLGPALGEVATFKDLGALNPGIVLSISFGCSVPIATRISIRAADSQGLQNYTGVLTCLE